MLLVYLVPNLPEITTTTIARRGGMCLHVSLSAAQIETLMACCNDLLVTLASNAIDIEAKVANSLVIEAAEANTIATDLTTNSIDVVLTRCEGA